MGMDRRTLLKTLAAAMGGLAVSAHHRPWHEKGPKSTTTTTTTTTTPTVPTTQPTTTTTQPVTTTTSPPPTTSTTIRPLGDPVYGMRNVTINPGQDWQDAIDAH